MTKYELRSLYDKDMLVEAVVEHSMVNDGWILEFRHSRGGLVPLTNGKGVERCFADVDSASDHAFDVGFNQIRIIEG